MLFHTNLLLVAVAILSFSGSFLSSAKTVPKPTLTIPTAFSVNGTFVAGAYTGNGTWGFDFAQQSRPYYNVTISVNQTAQILAAHFNYSGIYGKSYYSETEQWIENTTTG